MRTAQEMVAEFHRVMDQPIETTPTLADEATRQLRYDLIAEEAEEYRAASGARGQECAGDLQPSGGETPDLVAMARELGDLEYVVRGTALAHGIPLDAVVAEIHRANMSKLDENGKPIKRPDGKVLKGPNYRPPDVESVLVAAGMVKP